MRTHLSKNIKKHRKYNGLNTLQLANILQVSEQTVLDYESGKAIPDEKTLLELAKLFKVSTDFLSSGESLKDCYLIKDAEGRYNLTKMAFFSIITFFTTQVLLGISNVLIYISGHFQSNTDNLMKMSEISEIFLVGYNIVLNILLIAVCVCMFAKMKYAKIASVAILFAAIIIFGALQTGVFDIILSGAKLVARYFSAVKKGKVLIIVMFAISAVNMINHNRFVRNTYHNYHNRNNIKDRYL